MYFLSHISIHASFLLFYLYKKIKLSIKDYLLLIHTFMCMIIFLRIIILSFQSHQIRILSAGLGMAWNREWLSCTFFLLLRLFALFREADSNQTIILSAYVNYYFHGIPCSKIFFRIFQCYIFSFLFACVVERETSERETSESFNFRFWT